ncbi:hypothetical protein [uncultured Bacteroides sp.]|jgi:hypothetical protein|uniref:hypothetical protein n=1 Tax=uncultured Bacteroides sp. TaxID=162156 RepID=UPI0023CE082B|nr:hypothetical protein [uncultured Bacteroides sp.]MDE6172253.1 hypothetical protein [Bacteroides sp.]
MKLSQASLSLLETTIRQAVSKYTCNCQQTIVTDIHLQANQTSGELTLFDDDDNEMASTVIEEWVAYENNDFYGSVERKLSSLLNSMKNKGEFDKVAILMPYSFVLVDDEKETVAELLLMDDDTLLVNEELLKGLDEELDAFLKKLLE